MTTIAEVLTVAAKHRISRNGFLPDGHEREQPFDEHDIEMIIHARAFIRAKDRERFKRSCSTYSLKHAAEKWRGEGSVRGRSYVTNGAFLVACFLEDLKPRRIWYVDVEGHRLTINGMVRLP